MPSAEDGGSTVIVLRHDHQRRHADRMIDIRRALPVARHVAVPVDAAGEAGFGEGIDEHLLFLRRQDRRARIVLGVIARNHLRKCQIELAAKRRRRRPAPLRAPCRRRGTGLRMKASKVCSTRLPNIRSGSRAGILKLHDIHLLAETRAQQFDRIGRGAVGVRGVDADNAGDAIDMPQRHLPDDEAAPVVADEDRLVDLRDDRAGRRDRRSDARCRRLRPARAGRSRHSRAGPARSPGCRLRSAP